MSKLLKGIVGILIALCLVLLYFIYLQFPQPTYKLNNPPKLLTAEVSAGEEVRWQNDVCKLHDHDFYSQRTFINLDTGRKYIVPEYGTRGTLKKGECRVNEVTQKVPNDLSPGHYQLLVEVFVKTSRFSTDKFEYTVGIFIIN